MIDKDQLGRWLRIAGALRRFGSYVESYSGRQGNYQEALARLGLAATVGPFFLQVRELARQDGIEDEYGGLFSGRQDLHDTATVSHEHLLALLIALTGWVEGHAEMLTIEERIEAEAEALARERAKLRPGFAAPRG